MDRSDRWTREVLTDRKGLLRGMEIGMPLGEALALEHGDRFREHDHVLVRADLEPDVWAETEIRFARLRGLDRVVGVRHALVTRAHPVDAEGCFRRLAQLLAERHGPPAPSAGPDPKHKVWRVQGHEVPTALRLDFTDALDEDRVRTARVTLSMERAAG